MRYYEIPFAPHVVPSFTTYTFNVVVETYDPNDDVNDGVKAEHEWTLIELEGDE